MAILAVKKTISVLFVFAFAFFLSLIPAAVLAEGKLLEPCVGGTTCDTGLVCQDGKICVLASTSQGPQTAGELFLILNNIVNWVFAFVILLSILFIILGAFEFVTAAGDPTKVATARQRLIWAAVGIGVAMLARSFPAVIRTIIS